MKLVVVFETPTLDNYSDSMVIVSNNDFKKEIKLHAY